ncbi:hypothetical protein GCM10027074_20470 [Streptomyces deserti]
MVEWHHLRGSGVRPVPEPVATPFVWAAAFAGSALMVVALGAAGPLAGSAVALGALCGLAALLGLPARFRAAPGIAVVCWLFLNAFTVAPRGELSWQGRPDVARIILLLGAALVGTLVARIVHAIGAHRRVTGRDNRGAAAGRRTAGA